MKIFPKRLFFGGAVFNVLIGVLSILCTYQICKYFFYTYSEKQVVSQLRSSLYDLNSSLGGSAESLRSWCSKLPHNKGSRYTLVRKDGVVVCDNYHDTTTMDNHAQRPEILNAVSTGWGTSRRYSKTVETDFLYGAIRVDLDSNDFLIFRKSVMLDDLFQGQSKNENTILLILLPVFIFISFVLVYRSYRMLMPLGFVIEKLSIFEEEKLANIGNVRSRSGLIELNRGMEAVYQELKTQKSQLESDKQWLSSLLESISDGIVAFDSSNKILFKNSIIHKVFGGEELLKVAFLEQGTGRKTIEGLLDVARSTGEAFTLRGLKLEEKEFYFDLFVTPIWNGGRVNADNCLLVMHDVTEMKRLENMRVDFIGNISHEVRTPLTALQGASDLLLADNSSNLLPQTRELILKLTKSSGRMIKLFNDLLDLSKLESNLDLNLEPTQIEAFVQRIITSLSYRFEKKLLDKVLLSDVEEMEFNIDQALIEHILTNLIGNALKYATGFNVVRIQIKRLDDDHLSIKVEDDGPGISDEFVPRIFERFYRVDQSRSSRTEGTGLGLAIVKHAVQKHKGHIEYFKTELGGAGFKMKLFSPLKIA